MHDPLAQAGLAPFLAGFAVALILFKLRLSGLAAVAGFCTTAWLMGMLDIAYGTGRQRMVMLSLAAPALGLLADLALRPGRTTAYVLGVVFGASALWAFSASILQKPPVQAFVLGGGLVLFVAWTVAMSASLHANSVRAGATGLGLAAGFVFLPSLDARLGMALGAASAGFLLVQMMVGRIDAGLVFTLAVGVGAALFAAAELLAGRAGWTQLAVLAAVPLAARLPLPARWPVWGQALLASFYTALCGGAAAGMVYVEKRGWPSWLQ
jgi:hypothetical protein